MADFFNGVISSIRAEFDTVGTFVILLAALSVAFVAFLSACIFKREFTHKKRAAFLPFAVGAVAVQGGVEIAFGGTSYVLILSGVCVLMISAGLVIPVKKTEYKEEHVEFARFIDQKVKSAAKPEEYSDRTVGRIKCVEREEKPESNAELDFSHVKNILKKMEFYPLSVSDKRQVKDLTAAVNLAESGDNGAEIKSRINDGLGALLKIMSKHGI